VNAIAPFSAAASADRLRVLLIAPNVDGTDVGEAYVAFKWAEALAEITDLTVLSFQRPGRAALAPQLPGARVVTWPEPQWAVHKGRLNSMLKPAFPIFSRLVRNFMAEATARGEHFDIAHQVMPQAPRYATPLRHASVPYVLGPIGGALDTPEAFRAETGAAPLFTRLRALDGLRLRHDPALRASYTKAALVLGVAPYVQDVLAGVPLARFGTVLELGIDDLAPETIRPANPGQLKLLHVGRAVRTKGLRDVVRALAHLKDRPGITLTSAGNGEDLALCQAEAERLGVADRCRFLGAVPRAEIEALYASHDVFAFPSFREAAGGVLYEAMRWGLPVITAARGGPDSIIDDRSGLRVPVSDPQTYAADLAQAIRKLDDDPALRLSLGRGARAKVGREGLWPQKARALVAMYRNVLNPSGAVLQAA
jgi:glycosyltransferase involved in cell wall biosynthesis